MHVTLTQPQRVELVARGAHALIGIVEGEEGEQPKSWEDASDEARAEANAIAEGLLQVWDGLMGTRHEDPAGV